MMAFASLQAQLSAFPTRRRSVPGRQPINSFLSRSLRTAVALLEELLRRLTRSVDFAVNEHTPSVGATGLVEFPGYFVTLTRKFRPF